MSVDPKIVSTLIDAGVDVAKWLVEKATGGKDHKEAKAIAKAMAEAAIMEARHQLELRGLVTALDEIDDAAKELLAAMVAAESGGGLPKILEGADVQEMPADWHPPKEETIDEKLDTSDVDVDATRSDEK